MGTTKTALDAGSTSFVWVVAIEGYESLLCSGATAAAVTAWAGTDWSTALGGLFVEMSISQSLDPDNPFPGMGSCNLWLTPDAADTFGIVVGRKTSPFETYLNATIDNDDTTVTVKSTSAFASSGTIHIGTEAIAYTGKSATTFTGCTRGKYSPFAKYGGGGFGHGHAVPSGANEIILQPIVGSKQRTWPGRWVGVWAHRVVAGVLDIKSEAHLVYAGRIDEVRDHAEPPCTVIALRGVTDVLADTVIGTNQWEASVEDGVWIVAGDTYDFQDHPGTAAVTKYANALTVVAGAAVGANQITEGRWPIDALCSKFTAWLQSEKAATRIYGAYTVSVNNLSGGLRTKVKYRIDIASPLAHATWDWTMSPIVARFLGFTDPIGADQGRVTIHASDPPNVEYHYYKDFPPFRVVATTNNTETSRIGTNLRSGDLTDQYARLPSAFKPAADEDLSWGVFMIGDKRMIVAAWDPVDTDPVELTHIRPAFKNPNADPPPDYSKIVLSAEDANKLIIRQIYAFEASPDVLMLQFALSTATSGYNSPDADTLPLGCGAEIPYEIVSGLHLQGITLGGTGSIAVLIEKPTKLSELLRSDYVFRWQFLHWRDSCVSMGQWATPSTSLAVHTLADSNKAEPSGHSASQRSATTETSEWLRQIVKIRYNRDATDPQSDAYKSTIRFVDRVAVDDAGGPGAAKVVTISLRNTSQEFDGIGQSVESMLPKHLALMPLVSRPARKVTRSIDSRYFLQLGIGDVVLFDDLFARDPETGLRGITSRPALVTRLRYNYGGLTPGAEKASPMGGEVDLFFTDQNPDRFGALYVPSADIRDDWNFGSFLGGYDHAASTIKCYSHRYSESTEATDASNFPATYKILIIERDPADPASPTMWERTVSTQSVDDIVLTAQLSSPAWDNAKKYHVLYQDYDTALTAQKVKAYQADDGDGLIIDIAQPALYGSAAQDSTYTANSLTEIEMPATDRYAEGSGRDVAHEAALARLVNVLVDYKTACSSPMLFPTVVSNTTVSGTSYLLVAYWPVFLSLEILSSAVFRYISAAPWAYSTDGTSTKIRVTLSRDRPSFSTTTDVPWSGIISQAEWTGITSTTNAIQTADELTANVKHPFTGQAWVSIELGYKCASWGLAKWVEGARQTS